MPVLQNQTPASMAKRVLRGTGIYLEVYDADGVDAATLVIYLDARGDGNWQTVYSSGSFQGSFSGTVNDTGNVVEVQINNPGIFEILAPVHVRVLADDDLGNPMDAIYWFQIIEVEQPITPIYPTDGERLVSTDETLAIGFRLTDPLTVTVAGTLAYDDSLVPKFRNGWTGSFLDDDDGKRLLLTPPAAFTINTNINVNVATSGSSLDYTFRVGSQQITTSGDVDRPRIVEAASANVWVGYIRDNELILRKGDPLTGEVTVIPASQWDHGYDATLGKYVLYWIDNGKVFFSTADAGDLPEVLPQPSVVNAVVSSGLAGSERIYVAARLPTQPPDPIVKGVPPDGVLDLDIYKPTGDPAADQLVSFKVMSWWHGTANQIATVAASPTQDPVTYTIPDYVPGAQYFVIPVYDRGGQLLDGTASNRVPLPEYSSHAVTGLTGSEKAFYVLNSEVYLPLKYFRIDDADVGLAGSERLGVFEITSYEMIQQDEDDPADVGLAASERLGILLVGGFGIIGVG